MKLPTPAEVIEGNWFVDAFGCHIWEGGYDRQQGYGITRVGSRAVRTHVLAYVAAYGPVPPGKEVHHKCENPACMNPQHLQAVTKSEHGLIHRRQERFHMTRRWTDLDEARMLAKELSREYRRTDRDDKRIDKLIAQIRSIVPEDQGTLYKTKRGWRVKMYSGSSRDKRPAPAKNGRRERKAA